MKLLVDNTDIVLHDLVSRDWDAKYT